MHWTGAQGVPQEIRCKFSGLQTIAPDQDHAIFVSHLRADRLSHHYVNNVTVLSMQQMTWCLLFRSRCNEGEPDEV